MTDSRVLEAARFAFLHTLKPYFGVTLGGLPAAVLYAAFADAVAAYQKEQRQQGEDDD